MFNNYTELVRIAYSVVMNVALFGKELDASFILIPPVVHPVLLKVSVILA